MEYQAGTFKKIWKALHDGMGADPTENTPAA
jgi:hypothetical protein